MKFERKLQKHLHFVDDKVTQGVLDIISDLNDLPLLTKFMIVCPLPDLELERLFKNLRSGFLSNIFEKKDASNELLKFQSA